MAGWTSEIRYYYSYGDPPDVMPKEIVMYDGYILLAMLFGTAWVAFAETGIGDVPISRLWGAIKLLFAGGRK